MNVLPIPGALYVGHEGTLARRNRPAHDIALNNSDFPKSCFIRAFRCMELPDVGRARSCLLLNPYLISDRMQQTVRQHLITRGLSHGSP